ncbi:MAG: hypothetical protein PUP46_02620 [Endozoicomonas sp. (ex Botrylloides leachii)]|nr:hypothetical protein [Endozoicomonas sp. (ex Botrylloides leachii)]
MSREWINYLKSQGAWLSGEDGQIHFPASKKSIAQVCVLSDQTIIIASGCDTVRFLQGQLTCNIATLAPMKQTVGTVCTPRGRMYSTFTIGNANTHYLLRMHKGVAENFITGLGKYAVFYKSELSRPAESYICLGLAGSNIEHALQSLDLKLPDTTSFMKADAGWLLKTAHLDNSYEWWIPAAELPRIWEKLIPHFSPTGETFWRQRRIAAVIPEVKPEIVEKYIPQDLNLPSLGYVSFQKGCYTGQEIVARMQNLGQQKKRTYSITITGTNKVAANAKLLDEKGKTIGEILESVAIAHDKYEALAVLKINAKEVFLDNQPECQITINAIPYTIDARAELQF